MGSNPTINYNQRKVGICIMVASVLGMRLVMLLSSTLFYTWWKHQIEFFSTPCEGIEAIILKEKHAYTFGRKLHEFISNIKRDPKV